MSGISVVFGEIEDGLNVLLRLMVCKERGMRCVPGTDDVFSLHTLLLALLFQSRWKEGRTFRSDGRLLLPRSLFV